MKESEEFRLLPYHKTTVTDTNSTHPEVESCHKHIWCPTTKIKNVQCGCAPVTTQFIWMLVKKLKKPLLQHLLNSRHRWEDGIPEVEVLRRSRADAVTVEALITSYHLFLSSLGRKFQRNKLFQFSKSSVLWQSVWGTVTHDSQKLRFKRCVHNETWKRTH